MNPVVHFELPYENADRAAAFYRAAFGWQIQQLDAAMGNYVVVTTATADAKADAPHDRAFQAIMRMRKVDIAALDAAFAGR